MFALVALVVVSCAGGPSGTTPRDGTIIYCSPVAEVGVAGRTIQPITQIFTTGSEEIAEDSALQTHSGVIEGAGDTRADSERNSQRVAQMIFERHARNPTMILSPERFTELWSRLSEAGLFKLDELPDQEPPDDAPYFLIRVAGQRTIYRRPEVRALQPDDPGVLDLNYWRQAKITFFNFLNEQ